MSRRWWGVVALGVLLTVVLALLASPWASDSPDGLEKVAADQGFDQAAEPHDLADGPTADYEVDGVRNDRLSTGLAGAIGVVVTFLVGAGAVLVVRRTVARRTARGRGQVDDDPDDRPEFAERHGPVRT